MLSEMRINDKKRGEILLKMTKLIDCSKENEANGSPNQNPDAWLNADEQEFITRLKTKIMNGKTASKELGEIAEEIKNDMYFERCKGIVQIVQSDLDFLVKKGIIIRRWNESINEYEYKLDENYYQKSPKLNPDGPANGKYRVLRGGAYNSSEALIRVTARTMRIPEGEWDTTGFRCVKPVKKQ